MLHDFHKAHHPSDECSHFGERLHDTPAHCSCLFPGLQAPPGGSCADTRPAADTRGTPGQQDAAVPAPCSPPSSHPVPHRGPGTPPVPPCHRSTVGTEPPSAGLLFSPLASQFHLNRIASASTNDAHKLTMLNVSNLTSHFLVNSVKFLCFITDSYSRRACVK